MKNLTLAILLLLTGFVSFPAAGRTLSGNGPAQVTTLQTEEGASVSESNDAVDGDELDDDTGGSTAEYRRNCKRVRVCTSSNYCYWATRCFIRNYIDGSEALIQFE